MDGSDSVAAQRLTRLFNAHCDQIRKFAHRRVGADAAQEIVADTFLAAWRHIYELPEEPLSWLYRAASFEIANYQRRQLSDIKVRSVLALEPWDRAGREEDRPYALSEALNSMSPEDQELLRLAAWDQVSTNEGAAILGCSAAAYRVRLHRARRRLARRLREVEPEVGPVRNPASQVKNAAQLKRKEASG